MWCISNLLAGILLLALLACILWKRENGLLFYFYSHIHQIGAVKCVVLHVQKMYISQLTYISIIIFSFNVFDIAIYAISLSISSPSLLLSLL